MRIYLYCATVFSGYKRKVFDSTNKSNNLNKLALAELSEKEKLLFCNQDICYGLINDGSDWLLVINHIPCAFEDFQGRTCYNNFFFRFSEEELSHYYRTVERCYAEYSFLLKTVQDFVLPGDNDYSVSFDSVLSIMPDDELFSKPTEMVVIKNQIDREELFKRIFATIPPEKIIHFEEWKK